MSCVKSNTMMTNEQMRIALAKDVIKHLNFLEIQTGSYVEGDFHLDDGVQPEMNAQAHIDAIEANCKVCALGACFLSYVRLFDKVPLAKFIGPNIDKDDPEGKIDLSFDELAPELEKVFSKPQLVLIEIAFETRIVNDSYVHNPSGYNGSQVVLSQEEAHTAIMFGEQYDDASDRLRAIMKNIVKNHGTFIPVVTKKAVAV